MVRREVLGYYEWKDHTLICCTPYFNLHMCVVWSSAAFAEHAEGPFCLLWDSFKQMVFKNLMFYPHTSLQVILPISLPWKGSHSKYHHGKPVGGAGSRWRCRALLHHKQRAMEQSKMPLQLSATFLHALSAGFPQSLIPPLSTPALAQRCHNCPLDPISAVGLLRSPDHPYFRLRIKVLCKKNEPRCKAIRMQYAQAQILSP